MCCNLKNSVMYVLNHINKDLSTLCFSATKIGSTLLNKRPKCDIQYYDKYENN